MNGYRRSLLVIACIFMGLAIILGAAIVNAQSTVTFQWDTNDETDLAGYRLWQAVVSGGYDQNQPPAFEILLTEPTFDHTGDTCQWSLNDIPDGTYFWVLTAFDDETPENESGFSNEVTATLDSTAPVPPGGLLISAIDKMIAGLRLDKKADNKRIAALKDLREYVVQTMPIKPEKVGRILVKFN